MTSSVQGLITDDALDEAIAEVAALLVQRANHMGSQPASTISDSTAAGRAILTAADAAAQRAALGVSGASQAKTYVSYVSSATPTPAATASVNQAVITAQAAATMLQTPVGTPADGNYIEFTIRDDGTARAITHSSAYKASDRSPLPYTTIVGKELTAAYRYYADIGKWVCMDIGTVPIA